MKIIYLDQLHWIEIAKQINGRPTKPGTEDGLKHILHLSNDNVAIFPLSISHYYETLKQSDPGRRQRLAQVMRQISKSLTVSALGNIVNLEIENALISFFEINRPHSPISYIGKGLEHTLGRTLNMEVDWPVPELIAQETKEKIEESIFDIVEEALLSGTLKGKTVENLFHHTDVSSDIKFKDHLQEWKGCASRCSEEELRRKIFAFTYQDISKPILKKVMELGIPNEQFSSIGEKGLIDLINLMPSRKVDMWLREQWARNEQLTPKLSDLNDWCHIGGAVPYCDFVVTENQMSDLLSRSSEYKLKVTSKLTDLIDRYA